jgi:hypothetical protein
VRRNHTIAITLVVSGCIVPPEFLGGTAESGSTLEPGTDDGSSASSEGGDGMSGPIDPPAPEPCTDGCGVEQTSVPIGTGDALELTVDHLPLVLTAPADTAPSLQSYGDDLIALGPAIVVDVLPAGTFAAFDVSPTGWAAIAYENSLTPQLYRLDAEMSSVAWSEIGLIESLAGDYAHDVTRVTGLQVTSSGAVRMSGTLDDLPQQGDWFEYFAADGHPQGASAGCCGTDLTAAPQWLGDPSDEVNATMTMAWDAGDYGPEDTRYWMVRQPGNDVAPVDVFMAKVGVSALVPVRGLSGYVMGGAATADGGVWLQRVDGDLVESPPVLDVPGGESPVPIALAATSDRVLVFAADSVGLSLRIYDAELVLTSVLALELGTALPTSSIRDVEVASDDTVYVLGRDTAMDGATTDWLGKISL